MADTKAAFASIAANLQRFMLDDQEKTYQTSPLLKLPDEILGPIVRYAGGGSVIALRKTCRRLHIITPTWDEVSQDEASDFLTDLERRPGFTDFYACHRCRNLQHKSKFLDRKMELRFDMLGPHQGRRCKDRLCLECQAACIVPGIIFPVDRGRMGKCWHCEKITVEFCRDCQWCYDCGNIMQEADTKTFRIQRNSGAVVGQKTLTSEPCEIGSHCWNSFLTNGYYDGVTAELCESRSAISKYQVFLAAWRRRHYQDLSRDPAEQSARHNYVITGVFPHGRGPRWGRTAVMNLRDAIFRDRGWPTDVIPTDNECRKRDCEQQERREQAYREKRLELKRWDESMEAFQAAGKFKHQAWDLVNHEEEIKERAKKVAYRKRKEKYAAARPSGDSMAGHGPPFGVRFT